MSTVDIVILYYFFYNIVKEVGIGVVRCRKNVYSYGS